MILESCKPVSPSPATHDTGRMPREVSEHVAQLVVSTRRAPRCSRLLNIATLFHGAVMSPLSNIQLTSLPTYNSVSTSRLKALYSDFSLQKHSNPTSYSFNVEWWRRTLEAIVLRGWPSINQKQSAIPDRLVLHAEGAALSEDFRFEGVGKPLSLPTVIVSGGIRCQSTELLIVLLASAVRALCNESILFTSRVPECSTVYIQPGLAAISNSILRYRQAAVVGIAATQYCERGRQHTWAYRLQRAMEEGQRRLCRSEPPGESSKQRDPEAAKESRRLSRQLVV